MVSLDMPSRTVKSRNGLLAIAGAAEGLRAGPGGKLYMQFDTAEGAREFREFRTRVPRVPHASSASSLKRNSFTKAASGSRQLNSG
jgi:hypothetical protein